MPQPLSRVSSRGDIEVSTGALANSPEFAAKAMQVIGLWSGIDSTLSLIIARVLDADAEAAVAMYQALSSADARRAALLAAAERKSPRWQFILLQACLKAIKPSRDQRNDFAHHIWGSSPALPGRMLLMHPNVHVARSINRFTPKGAYDRDKIFVYSQADMSAAVARAQEASMITSLLYMVLGDTIEQARRQILSIPIVQQAIQPLIDNIDPLTRSILISPIDGDPPPRGLYPDWDRTYWSRPENKP